MPKRKLPKPGPEQPPVNRVAKDTYPRGNSGIHIHKGGKRIRVGKIRKKGK